MPGRGGGLFRSPLLPGGGRGRPSGRGGRSRPAARVAPTTRSVLRWGAAARRARHRPCSSGWGASGLGRADGADAERNSVILVLRDSISVVHDQEAPGSDAICGVTSDRHRVARPRRSPVRRLLPLPASGYRAGTPHRGHAGSVESRLRGWSGGPSGGCCAPRRCAAGCSGSCRRRSRRSRPVEASCSRARSSDRTGTGHRGACRSRWRSADRRRSARCSGALRCVRHRP